jgi:hypothetical protein
MPEMAMFRSFSLISFSLIALCSAIFAAGCGGDNPLGRMAVRGTATLDGAPIASGSVDFQPLQQGGVGSGAVIKDGQFSIEEQAGLPPGKYKVAVYASDPSTAVLAEGGMPGDDVPVPKELVPPDWNVNSQQTIEVSDSSQEFKFDISTK